MRLLVDHDWPGNVRELRNLVESMVVLSPGSVVRPEDIPHEIRDGSSHSMLIALPRVEAAREGMAGAPELEFIFRTLIQLRIDVEELRRRFDEYRETHPELTRPVIPFPLPGPSGIVPRGAAIEEVVATSEEAIAGPWSDADDDDASDGVVVYRRGMTLQDMERAAITAALRDVKGNRRRAAEILGMGERTLYRKIKEYDIPL
jgi:DNA-binding NtrC family response regulator